LEAADVALQNPRIATNAKQAPMIMTHTENPVTYLAIKMHPKISIMRDPRASAPFVIQS
jgi:hypothetical protein